MPPVRLLVIRHAQSEWNAAGRWQGQADPPLSALGREQARLAAQRLGAFDAIVASPLERAGHTAATIAEGIGVGPVLVDPDLQERHAGEWEGLTRDEIEAGWPGYLEDRRRPPGFESDESLLARALAALGRVAGTVGGGEVLVVAHGGVIYRLEDHTGARAGRIPNLGGRWFVHHGDRLEADERVELLDQDADPATVPRQL